jgi:hypothetical protein
MRSRKRKTLRARVLAAVLTVAGGGVIVLPTVEAQAALTSTINVSGSYNNTSGGRYTSRLVGGQYMLQTDDWNKAASGTFIAGAHAGDTLCQPGTFNLNYDPNSPAFSVTNNTANSYFPDGNEPGCGNGDFGGSGATHRPCIPRNSTKGAIGNDPSDPTCKWAGTGDPWKNPNLANAVDPNATTGPPADWLPPVDPNAVPRGSAQQHQTGTTNEFSDQIHAPASYPSIFLGCHWGTCTPGHGQDATTGESVFPMELNGLVNLPVVWDINTTQARQAGTAWDASLDIWLDTNSRTGRPLPANPAAVNGPGQNDGAEVMVWANNAGYNPTNPSAGIIQPVGTRIQTNITLGNGNVPGHWDVWAGRARSFDNGLRWNVISFVSRERTDAFHTGGSRGPVVNGVQEGGVDVKMFLDYAVTIGAKCTTSIPTLAVQETVNCVNGSWYLTSVQAGFEIWNLPTAGVLTTNMFSVSAVGVVTNSHRISSTPYLNGFPVTDSAGTRSLPRHNPVLGNNVGTWALAQACPGASDAHMTLVTGNGKGGPGAAIVTPMSEWPPGSGVYNGPAVMRTDTVEASGPSALSFTANCPDGTIWSNISGVYMSDAGDIMWINKSTGQLFSWQLDFDGDVVGTPALSATCDVNCRAAWQVVGAADMDGGGTNDLVWFNNSTGEVAPWLLFGSTVEVGPTLSRKCAACLQAGWRVVGAADMNGDGYGDILWHNTGTGALVEWLTNGSGTVTSTVTVGGVCGAADGCSNGWKAVGIGDFNDDGTQDILWANASSDLYSLWLLDFAGNLIDSKLLNSTCGGCPASKSIMGAADSISDGNPDLYWWNHADGLWEQWRLDGNGGIVGKRTLASSCGDADGCTATYAPLAVADFSAD